MKCFKYLITSIFLFLFFCVPSEVDAASISVAATRSQAVVGGSVTVNVRVSEPSGLGAWEFNLSYDSSMLQLTSGAAHVVDYAQGPGSTSRSYAYTFKVLKKGTATVSIASSNFVSFDEVTKTSPKDSTSFKCVTQQEILDSYSKDNNLSSLKVENYEISPSFDKDTLEYKLELENDVEKINITGNKSDSKASVNGLGEKEVHEGVNNFEIVVTAENGTTKTYKLIVTVKELNPVEVKIDGKKTTVVRKKEELEGLVPNHFEEATVKINDEEVLAYYNKVLKLNLVALKDEDGNIKFYIYKNNKYQEYLELSSGSLTIHLLTDKAKIPKGFSSYQEKIDKVKYQVYKKDKNSDLFLVYGENVETGKKSLYVYDKVEKTIQRYQNELFNNKNFTFDKYTVLIICITVVTILIIFLILLNNNKTKAKKIKVKKRRRSKYGKEEE